MSYLIDTCHCSLQERQKQLESMGISLESSGIKVGEDKCFLVNLNADPALNELLVYYLKVHWSYIVRSASLLLLLIHFHWTVATNSFWLKRTSQSIFDSIQSSIGRSIAVNAVVQGAFVCTAALSSDQDLWEQQPDLVCTNNRPLSAASSRLGIPMLN